MTLSFSYPDRGSNFFYGKRFVRGNDSATGLIFDCAGRLAGMQATVCVKSEFEREAKNNA